MAVRRLRGNSRGVYVTRSGERTAPPNKFGKLANPVGTVSASSRTRLSLSVESVDPRMLARLPRPLGRRISREDSGVEWLETLGRVDHG